MNMAEEDKKGQELLTMGDWKPSAPGLAARGLDAVRRNLVAAEVVNPLAVASGVKMIRVPSGPFTMGSEGYEDEAPLQTVTLPSYGLSKMPITVGQFRAYTCSTGAKFDWFGRQPSWGWLDDHPMVRVTWEEARKYCRWAGGDLPTEAQWERAARGTDGRKYPWGDDWNPDLCVHGVGTRIRSRTEPIHRSDHIFAAPLGHTDMVGNVWEWCLGYWHSETHHSNDIESLALDLMDVNVVIARGGSFRNSDPDMFRAPFRIDVCSSKSNPLVGFRLASL